MIIIPTPAEPTYFRQIIFAETGTTYDRVCDNNNFGEWNKYSTNIPAFYKNYNDLASLASALRVNPPIIGDLAHKDSGSVKLNANYGNTYHVYITKYVSGADQLILGEYLVSFGNSGYLITLKEKTGELSTVNIENDGTVTATFSSEGYYRIRCLKR